MTIDSPDVERLVDEVARLTGESRTEAVRRALEERRERLAETQGPVRMPGHDAAARLAAWQELRRSLALTPEAADAWIAEIRAERDAHRIPGDVG